MGFFDNFKENLSDYVEMQERKQDNYIRQQPDACILHNIDHAANEVTREKCRKEAIRRGLI